MKKIRPDCFVADACINGSCPNAQYEAADAKWGGGIADDMGLEKITCGRCGWNTGTCNECSFKDSDYCAYVKQNEDGEWVTIWTPEMNEK